MNGVKWNCASREQKNSWAEDAGLLRRSAFARDLPSWHELSEDWKKRLSETASDNGQRIRAGK